MRFLHRNPPLIGGKMLLTILISLLGIIITLLLIIGFHEYGHFIAARLLGIKILRFSIGFGKPLWRRYDKKGTEYVIAAIPLGGYVKMLDSTEENIGQEDLPLAFNHQPFYKKFLVVIAGPLANLILAIVLYWLLFMMGFTSIAPVVGKVTPHSIAANAGFKPYDEILSVDHKPTSNWMRVLVRILSRTGDTDTMQITVKSLNNQTKQTYQLNLAEWHMDNLKPDPLTSLGLQPYAPLSPESQWPKNFLRHNQYGPIDALFQAWQHTYDFLYLNFNIIGKLITGKISLQSLGGPLSIFESAGAALNHGMVSFLSFLAFLSISVGIINVFPIPGLDGGHLLFQIIEAIWRRPIPPRVVALSYRLGLIVLVLLIFQAMVNDVLRLFT